MQTATADLAGIVPSTSSTLRKTTGNWTLREMNLLRRMGVTVTPSAKEPDRIVVSGEPRNGTYAKVVGHGNFVTEEGLPAGFRHLVLVPQAAS